MPQNANATPAFRKLNIWPLHTERLTLRPAELGDSEEGIITATLDLARARVKVGLANLVYNMRRMVWLAGAASA